jgi:two-component system response regulator LytT
MKAINCLVITTDERISGNLNKMLLKPPFRITLITAINFEKALEHIFESEIDFIIADADCLSFLKIKNLEEVYSLAIPIVIISDKPADAVRSYEIGVAVDFILKPLKLDRLVLAVNRVLKQRISYSNTHPRRYIFLKISRSYQRFDISDIYFIEAFGKYVKISTSKGMIVVNESISQMQERFYHAKFIRVHKSYIINTSKIMEFTTEHFDLPSGKIPIGENYKEGIESLLKMLSNDKNINLA